MKKPPLLPILLAVLAAACATGLGARKGKGFEGLPPKEEPKPPPPLPIMDMPGAVSILPQSRKTLPPSQPQALTPQQQQQLQRARQERLQLSRQQQELLEAQKLARPKESASPLTAPAAGSATAATSAATGAPAAPALALGAAPDSPRPSGSAAASTGMDAVPKELSVAALEQKIARADEQIAETAALRAELEKAVAWWEPAPDSPERTVALIENREKLKTIAVVEADLAHLRQGFVTLLEEARKGVYGEEPRPVPEEPEEPGNPNDETPKSESRTRNLAPPPF